MSAEFWRGLYAALRDGSTVHVGPNDGESVYRMTGFVVEKKDAQEILLRKPEFK
jgi:hypothetical protein